VKKPTKSPKSALPTPPVNEGRPEPTSADEPAWLRAVAEGDEAR
jgi:hypothetical protein